MKRLFADTFFFLAYLSSTDFAHAKAVDYFDLFEGELITTESVLTELADGMATPGDRDIFIEFYDTLRSEPDVQIVATGAELFAEGMNLFRSRLDKKWSLTDCISFVVMRREGLTEALTGDHHFEQAGFGALLK